MRSAALLWALAHPLALGRAELVERSDRAVTWTLRVSGTEQQGHALALDVPEGCAAQGPPALRLGEDGATGEGVWRCPAGLRGRTLRARGLEGSELQLLLRARLADGAVAEATLDDHRRRFTVPPQGPSRGSSWLRMGLAHIAGGADHLAFVACLALWVRRAAPLALAITGFTLGHSVTLALAATDALRAPSRPVEACVALSVLLLAREVARDVEAPPGAWRMSAACGLLHGLAFADALREVGVARGARLAALLGFNAGVELGQLVFVGLALGLARCAARAGLPTARARAWVTEAIGAWAFALLLARLAA